MRTAHPALSAPGVLFSLCDRVTSVVIDVARNPAAPGCLPGHEKTGLNDNAPLWM
jgi:hypothetical protein